MKLSEVKEVLKKLDTLNFHLEDGTVVPSHFHVTEVGKISKHFIDCGGTVRTENRVNFQLWNANDYDHRLHPEKLLNIIELSEKVLGIEDHEVEVEYQTATIGKFALTFDGKNFILSSTKTDCLAKDNCGIPQEQLELSVPQGNDSSCCTPGGGCC